MSTNKVLGKITYEVSGLGIPNLVVELLDVDPYSFNPDKENIYLGAESDLAQENFEKPPVDPDDEYGTGPKPEGMPADRLGSVITDENGYFELTYDDTAFNIRKKHKIVSRPTHIATAEDPPELRPDLFLIVRAPETRNRGGFDNVIYRSSQVRVNAGRNESYLISLSSDTLLAANVPPPKEDENGNTVEDKIASFKASKLEQRAFRKGVKSFMTEFDEEEKEEKEQFKRAISKAIFANNDQLVGLDNFVKETDTITEVQEIVFDEGAKNIDQIIAKEGSETPVPGKGIKVNLFLTEEEKAELEEYKFVLDGKDYYDIPEALVEQLLFKREEDGGINTILFSNNPISKSCIDRTTKEKCATKYTDLDNNDTTNDAEDEANPDIDETALSNDDIPGLVKKVLDRNTLSPAQLDNGTLAKRPDAASIQKNVDDFALEKGPADATAFYDFHSLQIAFKHVWQLLLDETLVNLSERAHYSLENSGRRGFKAVFNPSYNYGKFLCDIECAQQEISVEVPIEILTIFDVNTIEYEAMSSSQKAKLKDLAVEIAKEEGLTKVTNYVVNRGDKVVRSEATIDNEILIAVLREQGERIIDNIRVNKPFTTNQVLKELQEKLTGKYEFTIFAADKNKKSINFGILNTFRQKWEPISYQAGKLVKTIPLSPKEERKYSVKTSHKLKNTITQAQKNNSSLQSESSSTSRAEAEIIAKANTKTNFNMSVNVSYSSFSSEVGFGKDAAKESSESKKEFREAVLKSAQEYKEERSLQINTEESFDSEYTESGTIVNPNDELSVTYLFYELQRRYRVSEQLYRVMPVVCVAQEVPYPHQITKAWIIAHDWIINRVLLDDSFRNILQYLAQKNVGDDFAIRELRKNLRQQRTLTNKLKAEFSKLKIDVSDKYEAVRASTDERIEEEHEKRFYKRWWWWGWQVRQNQDAPPDPEMAKAIEKAAEDDYQHTVERAKELAMSVQREVNTLNQMTREYNAAMQDHLDRMTETSRLKRHIRDNILYYMQQIWTMEPSDQRYMRLYKVQIPYFEADKSCIVEGEPSEDIFEHFRKDGKKKHQAWLHGKIKRKANGALDVTYKQLVEIADLDTLLGFKGNYMIFPLKEHNALTEFMAAPYIDDAFGAMDPDQLSNINLAELSEYICCLHEEDPDKFDYLKPVLKKWLEQLLADPLRNGDEIIVPTDSLFIEMLPSDQSLLEDFKLQHRAWDVQKVKAETREMELENLRLAARLLDGQYDDPDVDKKIMVEGNGVGVNLNE